VLPCENPALTKEKLDFNDVLKQNGLSSLQALLVKQGLEGEQTVTSLEQENKDSYDQANKVDDKLTDHQDHLAAAQQEHFVDALSGKAAEQDITVSKGIFEETSQPLHDQKTVDAQTQRIFDYFERELNLEEFKHFDKADMMRDVKEDPIGMVQWWQERAGGTPFDPGSTEKIVSIEERNQRIFDYFECELNLEEFKHFDKADMMRDVREDPIGMVQWWQERAGGTPFDPNGEDTSIQTNRASEMVILKDFCDSLMTLEKEIKEFNDFAPGGTHVTRLMENKDTLIQDALQDKKLLNNLEQQRPEIYTKLQEHLHKQEEQKQGHSRSMAIDF
jgi:hypothetical protein